MCISHLLESKCKLGGSYVTLLMHFFHQSFFIKGSCFQNLQGLSLLIFNLIIFSNFIKCLQFLSLKKKDSAVFIVLSEASYASHSHFTGWYPVHRPSIFS